MADGYDQDWGFDEAKVTFAFFGKRRSIRMPTSSPVRYCGYRVEEIEDPLTQQVRYLDKLVDELAKGRTMEDIRCGKV